jgi:hypothetical protein
MITVSFSASLRQKGAGPLDAELLVEIESVCDGRLFFGVKHASKGFLGFASFVGSSLPGLSGPEDSAADPCFAPLLNLL